MDETAFRAFMKKEGRSASATQRSISYVGIFAVWLGRDPEQASEADLEDYARHRDDVENDAKTHLWGLRHYFRFVGNTDLAKASGRLRTERIAQRPYRLSELPIDGSVASALADHNIADSGRLLEVAATADSRDRLATATGLDRSQLEEVVELARFTLIRGVKDVRALLYRRTIGTLDELARHTPESLIEITTAYIDESGFAGIPPTPKEAVFTVAEAKRLLGYSS